MTFCGLTMNGDMMRISQLFGSTLRDMPAEADTIGHGYLLRAGYVRQLAAGIFTNMPLAQRTLRKIENIIREEMDAIGGQEITMPVVHPADIWKETERWYEVGEELTRFHDRGERDMVLAMTHEEVVTDLIRKDINSYRQLPKLIYQIQTKWRDEPRPRAGLIRTREFVMKDSYSLDLDDEGLDKQYRAHFQAYYNIFRRCGLEVVSVASDTGMMGGKLAHEFMYLTDIGEDTLMIDEASAYYANAEVANFTKSIPELEDAKLLEEVETPDTKTIETLAELLNIPTSKTAKAVFMVATMVEGQEQSEQFIFAVVRGDMDVNLIKLANAIDAKALRPATEDEIRAVGAEPGYGSPIGVTGCLIAVDDAIPQSPNLVAGANKEGYHYLNTNVQRDYKPDIVADIALAQDGYTAPDGKGTLKAMRGVEVGNIFKLGTRFTESMEATYTDKDSKNALVVMGSYGIGVGRLLACVAEEYHDDNGLNLPIAVAPYQVHLVGLKGADDEAEQLYADLLKQKIEVLYDDRDERPGVKFNDADLMGVPIRLTVSKRSLKNGGIEYKLRREDDREIVAQDDLMARIQSDIAMLEAEITDTVIEMEYRV
jgi:prolyl-tRNA synthetase